jgi:hypothetical protein
MSTISDLEVMPGLICWAIGSRNLCAGEDTKNSRSLGWDYRFWRLAMIHEVVYLGHPAKVVIHAPTGGFIASIGMDFLVEELDAETQARHARWTKEAQTKKPVRWEDLHCENEN